MSQAFASIKRGLEQAVRHAKGEGARGIQLRLKEGSNVVVLDRDVAKAFPDSAAVNKALRSVMRSRRPRRVSRP